MDNAMSPRAPLNEDQLFLLAGLIHHLPAQRAMLLALVDHLTISGQEWPNCCTELYPDLNLTLL